MLGRRIVEPCPAIEDTKDSQWLPEATTSLTVRRVKSAGLRIVTESEALWPDVSLGHVNTLRPPSVNPQSYLSMKTPDTSHTFGFPNPTMASPKHPYAVTSSPSASPATGILHARRLSRYSQVESTLRSAAKVSYVEVPPQELQIRVLEKATAILSEQARDAQACASKLRARLAEKGSKSLTREELEALQREYWMEEHRSVARKIQCEETKGLLTKLSSPISEVPPPLVVASPPLTRQEANLARFLQLSPTRIDLPRSRSTLTSPTLTRRKTISHARPMRLRPSALDLALLSPIQSHRRRSRSFDATHSRRNSGSTDATFVSEHSSEQSTVALPPAPVKSPSYPVLSELDGVIRIAKMASRRPLETLLAEAGDIAIPEYAVDLIEDFAASPISVDTMLSPVVFSRSPSTLFSPMSPRSQPPPQLEMPSLSALEDRDPRRSLSMPDFSHFAMEDEEPPKFNSPVRAPSRPSSPPSLPRPSSRTGNIIDRLRSPAAGNGTPVVPRRPATANACLRSTATQSLHASSIRFGSLRLSSPSLMTVPESDVDPLQRPQSSMSGYGYASPEAVLERAETGGEVKPGRGRFSISSIRRRRFNSTPSDVGTRESRSIKEKAEGAKGVLRGLRRKLSMLGSQR
ncbi:hypothetical protein DICSQDRAFT_178316 [Dichomitus squalens LYAD-421 SS1]|uniref:uncharacterized protein n=1 Tax=Dichomitus squalens (strain LYAD-421) TaxID=732165 RepID=UPI0004416149|nr:uncharacterized protein DICSQDRAFT_178316 [Dichomitus squalens LYAD-421 SS1]EJF64702.1 hypothetical protein DICSQDRAFT_178316 [Dichomitus squalens LYAD-421 SS1]